MKKIFLTGLTIIIMVMFTACSYHTVQKKQNKIVVETDCNLVLMTFNIRVGAGIDSPGIPPYKLKVSKENLQNIATMIKHFKADIICLQEVGGKEQAAFIANYLQCHYAYTSHKNRDFQKWGLATLSKFKFLQSHSEVIYPGHDRRMCLVSTIDIDGNPVTVLNVHYHLGDYESQVAMTMQVLHHLDRPLMLMGDLNRKASDPVLRPINEMLSDTFEAVHTPGSAIVKNWGTFLFYRGLRIDYIFVDKQFFIPCDVGIANNEHQIISDHLAYYAFVAFNPEKQASLKLPYSSSFGGHL